MASSAAGLSANSESAQDIASAFMKFQAHVTEARTDITGLVAELFSLSTVLLELEDVLTDSTYRRRRDMLDDERYIVMSSLDCTFKDVYRLLGGLGRAAWRTHREAYEGVWREIGAFFLRESGTTLLKRLEWYRLVLVDMKKTAQGDRPSRQLDDLLTRIDGLLKKQEESRLEVNLDSLTLGTRQRSWERRRPYGLHSPVTPPDPGPSIPGRFTPTFLTPLSPLRDRFDYDFPPVPDVPSSPTATTATVSTQSSSANSASSHHWLPEVFTIGRPTTQFETTGSESVFFGDNMANASARLRYDYIELLRLPFETGQLEVRLYLRPADRRARMLCKMERGNRRLQASYPLTDLRVYRKDSSLQFCKQDSRHRSIAWANLRFESYERMILFYCSFLALKAQDEARPISSLEDFSLEGERLIYSGVIIDDSQEHLLQILKDNDSGGVRLQACPPRGVFKKFPLTEGQPLTSCPIWTAFINYRMMAARWIQQVEMRKVHLRDLTRYIFSFDYQEHTCLGGEHELHFVDGRDARAFVDAIEEVAEGKWD